MRQDSTAKWIVASVTVLIVIAAASIFITFHNKRQVQLGGQLLSAQVANTTESRTRGLSNTDPLKSNEAMLFIFDQSSRWKIWMKDMRYNIDIVWLNEQKIVVHIVSQATPESYPQEFGPDSPAKYVLELPAGFAKEHNVTEGSAASFQDYNW
jgi:uncharacterized membrane protein (UPF0127 family)